jgi:hypothetical protein
MVLRSYDETVLVPDTGRSPSSIWPFCPCSVLPRLARSSLESANEGECAITLLSLCPSTVLLKSTSRGGTSTDEGIRETSDDDCVVEGHCDATDSLSLA